MILFTDVLHQLAALLAFDGLNKVYAPLGVAGNAVTGAKLHAAPSLNRLAFHRQDAEHAAIVFSHVRDVVLIDIHHRRPDHLGRPLRDKITVLAEHLNAVILAVAANGDIFVADGYANCEVHRFSADGKHLKSWGSPGSGPGEFTLPHGAWVDSKGQVLIADRENNRIQVFSQDGDFISQWPSEMI
ncbi:MAG TPA: 6-bladed beta-propeller, partial [Dehalococcoidia bacterium]|nr:6-bladed beta-propeller [Dehalococcoidia bacterium]